MKKQDKDAIRNEIDFISYYKLYIDDVFAEGDYHYLCDMLDGLINITNAAKNVIARHYPQQEKIRHIDE